MRTKAIALAAALSFLAATAASVRGAEFSGLGDADRFSTFPIGISGNGRIIVGAASSRDVVDTGAPFRWTPQQGIELLSEPAEESFTAHAVSANGRVIVGDSGSGQPLAHRWTRAGGWEPLGDLPGGDDMSSTSAVSGNGSVVVGASRVEPRAPWSSGWQAFRWTARRGMEGLGYANPTDIESNALDISRNGKFIVGSFTTATANTYAFRWSEQSGMQPLAGDPGNSQANAVSEDGRVVAGVSLGGFGPLPQAFRWTESGGMQGLGYLSIDGFHPSSGVTDMTDDGSIVVGYCFDGDTNHETVPFIWDAQHGMRSLRDVLIKSYGLVESLVGWDLLSGAYISGNGSVLTGVGRNPEGGFEGWRADLRSSPANAIPEPSTLMLGLAALVAVLFLHRGRFRAQAACSTINS